MIPLVPLQPLNVSGRVDCGQNVWKVESIGAHSDHNIIVQVVTVDELREHRFQELLLKK